MMRQRRAGEPDLRLVPGAPRDLQDVPRPGTIPDAGEQALRLVARLRAPARPDPDELRPADELELEELRATGVGRAFGVRAAWLSRDGRTCKLELGDGGPP
jgi:hypothetical protein